MISASSETGSGAAARRAHVIADGYSEPGIDVIIKSLGSDCGSVAGVMSADDYPARCFVTGTPTIADLGR